MIFTASHVFSWRHFVACLALLVAGMACIPIPVQAQPLPPPDPQDGQTFRVLAFHDVRKNIRKSFSSSADASDDAAVDITVLAGVFDWLHRNDYHPVSFQQILDARHKGIPLPVRPVLLTFDDGYLSFYTDIFPLLKAYNYPAVMALVTSWLEIPQGKTVPFGPTPTPRSNFLTWAQAKEMVQSGLVELASHTHDLHHGILSNPQGNVQAAAATHAYDASIGRYETDAEFDRRIERDLRKSGELIEKHTGQHPRIIVWPYGTTNDQSDAAAKRAGMPYGFTLGLGANTPAVPLSRIGRGYASYGLAIVDYETLLREPPLTTKSLGTHRAIHVDLDYVYDPDPAQQERNVSALIERIYQIGPSTVYLQAFADPDGSGVIKQVYFPNRHLPMRADLFNRVAWQLFTRANARVFAWMPVLAYQLPAGNPAAGALVQAQHKSGDAPEGAPRIARLSPFDPQAREIIREIYDDLGRHARFGGVLFHDDAFLGDDEDSSAVALKTYASWGLPPDVDAIRADPMLRQRWTDGKTKALTDFTLELTSVLRRWHPEVMTARNFFARPVLEPQAKHWFAQDLAASLHAYDYSAIMAMPWMEQEAKPQDWLRRLAKAALALPGAMDHVVFELQARDWRTGKPVPDALLQQQAKLLRQQGVAHLAYYPDDFNQDHPSIAVARANFSILRDLPFALRKRMAIEREQAEAKPAPAPEKGKP